MSEKTLEERVSALEDCQMKMAQQVEEMYQMFTNAGWTVKFVLKLFASVGIFTGGIIGILELIKACRR